MLENVGPNFFKFLFTFPKSTKPLFYIFKIKFSKASRLMVAFN